MRSRLATLLAREAWPLGISAVAFTLAAGPPSADPDMWWHLASGRWMVEHRALLGVDVFSSTATGVPYALGEWLGEVVLYLVFAVGSWTGIAVLRAALVSIAAFAATRTALRAAPPVVAVPLTAVAIVLSEPTWTDRPQLFTLALFPVLLELLFAARGGAAGPGRAGSRAALIATVPLLFVWSALHAGYALGLVLVWIFAVEAALSRRPAAGPMVAAGVIATAVIGLSPGALSFVRAIGHVGVGRIGIVEESPVDPLTPFGALFALAVGGTLVALMRAGASLLGALVIVPMLWLALSAQRHIPLFGFAALPFVAEAVASWLSPRASALAGGHLRRSLATMGPYLAGALWVGALASLVTAPTAPNVTAYPAAALPALRASSGVLLNEYDWGGFLDWSVPERPVFIDGRLFPFILEDVIGDYREAIALRPRWRAVLDRRAVSQVLLRPERPLVAALREDGWAVRSEGAGYVLLERPR